jgi:predicted nucleic acid-binding protein
MKYSVLLDTSFFIRLLNSGDSLHKNALNYFKYFLEHDVVLKISTISIAEYCVIGKIDDLPLNNLQIVPFNLPEAQLTGRFAKIIFDQNKVSPDKIKPRAIIPNDSKLFAQADYDKSIVYFVTSDRRSKSTFKSLSTGYSPQFEIIDISIPYHEFFGVLDL